MTHDERLKAYKELINKDIAKYSKALLDDTENEYGAYSRETLESFVAILSRGGKRLRGALTMASYEMLGGKDQKMIIKAARAIEMIHAYVLMIDDIADYSDTRRGGPSAHKIMQEYHGNNHLGGADVHFGESMATQAALIGGYLAELIIDDLDVSSEIKLSVLKNLHGNLVRTGQGQLRDILNEALPSITEEDAFWTAKYKTAYYTVINPLETGGILARASKKDLAIFKQFGMHAGIGFQIADDIIGIFGDSDITGKSSLDDLKEGKVTLLITHALANANKDQRQRLQGMLGNSSITEEDLRECQQIMREIGSLDYAKQRATQFALQARTELEGLSAGTGKAPELSAFLSYLTGVFIDRTA